VRLVGERTPDLPESGSDGSSGLWPADGGQVGVVYPKSVCWWKWRTPEVCLDVGVAGCRRDRSGQLAGGPSAGRQLARLLEARDYQGFVVMALAKGTNGQRGRERSKGRLFAGWRRFGGCRSFRDGRKWSERPRRPKPAHCSL